MSSQSVMEVGGDKNFWFFFSSKVNEQSKQTIFTLIKLCYHYIGTYHWYFACFTMGISAYCVRCDVRC